MPSALDLDVTEIVRSAFRDDTEGHQDRFPPGVFEGIEDGELEQFFVADHMVGRRRHDDGVRVPLENRIDRKGHTGGRMPAVGLEEQVFLRQFREDPPRLPGIAVQRDDQDILSGDDSGKTLVCLPQERFSCDIEELFRTVFTGNGPEPVPGSAGHDDAIVVRVHIGVIVMCT